MKRIIQLTADGSHTISIPQLNASYHSKFGAIRESKHVFIKEGLQYVLSTNTFNNIKTINVCEIGFGTGLNAWLSLNEVLKHGKEIFYQTIEPYPLSADEAKKLNYSLMAYKNLEEYFLRLHTCEWNKEILIHPLFSFEKLNTPLQNFTTTKKFHLIYFDAFDPSVQPELWTTQIFTNLFKMLFNNGVLVTYSSKGSVRRAMQIAGFSVEKIAGPPGKREIVRATRKE